jgi:hypothetical protein
MNAKSQGVIEVEEKCSICKKSIKFGERKVHNYSNYMNINEYDSSGQT